MLTRVTSTSGKYQNKIRLTIQKWLSEIYVTIHITSLCLGTRKHGVSKNSLDMLTKIEECLDIKTKEVLNFS